MRAVKSRHTEPEMTVRRLLYSMGFRYRLHRKDLPGHPDIVFPAKRKVVFVHGCFWHGHTCARGARKPKTNQEYWERKVGRNRKRDEQQREALIAAGWQVLPVWECETRALPTLAERLRQFLNA